MKNKLKDLTNLKYLSDAIVSFELKKYEVISKFAETSDWNQVYVNDNNNTLYTKTYLNRQEIDHWIGGSI